ncbi:MAG: hypothetical protein AAGA23_09790 [Pseudomonadota bacterium]
MKKWSQSLAEQIQRNAVALISLAIAVCSLSYNTWRNETSEHQRNLRHAAFEMVEHLERFQSMVSAMVYASPRRTELLFDAWGEAKALETLATLMPAPASAASKELIQVWDRHAHVVSGDDAAQARKSDEAVAAAVEQARLALLEVILSLE